MSFFMLDVPFFTILGPVNIPRNYVGVFKNTDTLIQWKYTRGLATIAQVISDNSELSI